MKPQSWRRRACRPPNTFQGTQETKTRPGTAQSPQAATARRKPQRGSHCGPQAAWVVAEAVEAEQIRTSGPSAGLPWSPAGFMPLKGREGQSRVPCGLGQTPAPHRPTSSHGWPVPQCLLRVQCSRLSHSIPSATDRQHRSHREATSFPRAPRDGQGPGTAALVPLPSCTQGSWPGTPFPLSLPPSGKTPCQGPQPHSRQPSPCAGDKMFPRKTRVLALPAATPRTPMISATLAQVTALPGT